MIQHSRFILSAVMVAALTACGGGGSDGNSGSSGGTTAQSPAPAPAPAQSNALKVSGTAATGLAIANAQVDVKCASGEAAGTTAADGTYAVTLPAAAQAPCALRVTLPDSTYLYSIVPAGATGSAVANITPLTQLLVAAASGRDPAELFSTFSSDELARINPQVLADTVKKISASLSSIVDISGIDPLTAPLVAATAAGGTGNQLDQLLDQLKAKLADLNVKLEELVTAVATNPNSDAPIKTLLAPSAANCPTLRSGAYFVMEAEPERIEFDATTLTFTGANGSLSLTAGTDLCTFTADSGATTVVVSNSGVALVRDAQPQGTPSPLQVLVPAQDLPKSELAGNWTLLGYEKGAGSALSGEFGHSAVKLTFDNAGEFVSGAECAGQTCETWPAEDALTVTKNANGSFALVDSNGTAPVLLYKNAKGQSAIFVANAEGGRMFGAKEQADVMPVVGAVTQSWDTQLEPLGNSTPFDASNATIATFDAASMSYTRSARFSGGSAQPDDAWTLNVPLMGMRYRAPTSGVSEIASLSIRGAGLSAGHLTRGNGTQTFLLSTSKVVAP